VVLILLTRPPAIDERTSGVLMTIVGVLIACLKDVYSFFFGSSKGSQDKTPWCWRCRMPTTRLSLLRPSAAASHADKFVRDNPDVHVNATSAITAAWTAVTDFQSLATRTASLAR
jgi:hypothetical protein